VAAAVGIVAGLVRSAPGLPLSDRASELLN
jgi:hypothetical protein